MSDLKDMVKLCIDSFDSEEAAIRIADYIESDRKIKHQNMMFKLNIDNAVAKISRNYIREVESVLKQVKKWSKNKDLNLTNDQITQIAKTIINE